MSINATLLGQMIVFAMLVWLTMKWIWPPLRQAMDERQQKIADGLAAAERGSHELDLAQEKAADILREARSQASQIIDQANKRSNEMIEEAKGNAKVEGEKVIAQAHAQVEQEVAQAKTQLRGQVVSLAMAGANKILKAEVDAGKHSQMLDELASQL